MHVCWLPTYAPNLDGRDMQCLPKVAHDTPDMQDEPTTQVPPQERVAQVRPYWETLSHEQRVDLLTLDVEFLHQRAVEVTSRTQKQLGEAHHACSLLSCCMPHEASVPYMRPDAAPLRSSGGRVP